MAWWGILCAYPTMPPSVQAISVACQNCGSPLRLSDGLRFVTCNHCGSELEIVHDDSTTHSKVLKRLEAKVDDTAQRLRVVELTLALERLDNKWKEARETYMFRGKHGESYEPGSPMNYLMGVVIFGFGSLMFLGVFSSRSGSAPTVIGFLMAAFAVFHLFRSWSRAKELAEAESRYLSQRSQIMAELEASQEGGR